MHRFTSLFSSVVARVVLGVVALGVLALVAATVAGAFAGTSTDGTQSGGTGGSSTRGTTTRQYYVSLGDSYAIGYQPSATPGGAARATVGYTGVVAKATGLRLANFGCAGATTTSVLQSVGCPSPVRALDGISYPTTTQAAAAEAFIRRHKGAIGLITVSIGGNDVTPCAANASPITCVGTAVTMVKRNVTTLAKQLRAAAGPHVPLIGLTYPDVLLGLWVYPPGHTNTTLASLSVTAFKSLFNPALQQAYDAGKGVLVDVTKDTGSYVPLSRTTSLAPYGTVPVAVARQCELTWYCTQGNIHAKTAGYHLIGKAVVARYRKLGGH